MIRLNTPTGVNYVRRVFSQGKVVNLKTDLESDGFALPQNIDFAKNS